MMQDTGEGVTMNGSRNIGAMILRGDRNLTLAHVSKLAAHFKVSPELFI
jgi:antitoxin component HigA of HigAB toxin-antitoxin module